MKKLITTMTFALVTIITDAQTLQLKFTTFEKYLSQNYTIEKVKTSLNPNYLLVKQDEGEWKFRDESKSWEALIYIIFDKTTKKIMEIEFTTPNNRVFELMDELEKDLGYKFIGTEGQVDAYENLSRKLGAKIDAGSLSGQSLALLRVYRK